MDFKKVKPLENVELLLDRIIIERMKVQDEVRETGFTVPAEARAKNINLPQYGHVVAVGPGDPAKGPLKVKAGDKVCFSFYSGIPLSIADRQFLIMREYDVIFILKN